MVRDNGGAAAVARPGCSSSSVALSPAEPIDVIRHHQGGRSRYRRGAHRIHPGFVHRSPAAGRALLRLRRDEGFLGNLRGADSARRDSGAALDLFRTTVADRARVLQRSGRAPLCFRRADRVSAGGSHRRDGARVHQGGAVQRLDHLLHADRRRRVLLWIDRLDLEAAIQRCHELHAADVSRHRLDAVRVHDPGRVALGHDHRLRHAAGRGQARRRRNFHSGWRCRRWSARSPRISTRTARS